MLCDSGVVHAKPHVRGKGATLDRVVVLDRKGWREMGNGPQLADSGQVDVMFLRIGQHQFQGNRRVQEVVEVNFRKCLRVEADRVGGEIRL